MTVEFRHDKYDAVVIGSGPNGLTAAIVLAQQGLRVLLVEAKDTIGGGVRSAQLTLPGFIHDPCAAVFPLSIASPFISSLPLDQFGLQWCYSPVELAHPLDGGRALLVQRSLDATAAGLGVDQAAYRRLLKPLLDHWDAFSADLLGPLPLPPRDVLTFVRFGLRALFPATTLARLKFRTPEAQTLFMGMAAHAQLPLDALATAAYGVVISATTHAVGWPFPVGGAQRLSDALAGYLRSLGGEIITGLEVTALSDLPPARAYVFDLTPRQILGIVGERFPPGYRRQLQRYRYGMGVFKLDYALDAPVPWSAEGCHQAATLHLGGSMAEIAQSEIDTAHGKHAARPYVLVSQPSLFDATRVPAGQHTLWAYCHVPHGSSVDMTEAIEGQIERYAPGFKRHVLARHARDPQEMQAYNANYIGGDINGGVQDLWQLYTRPSLSLRPYRTPLDEIFICSSSTPPGGGAHGMSGYHAAQEVLKRF